MSDEKQIESIIQEAVARELQEQSKEKQKSPGDTQIPLDKIDALKLDNIMLREENEKMRQQLIKADLESSRREFYDEIVSKYEIDIEKQTISIDAQKKTIQLKPNE